MTYGMKSVNYCLTNFEMDHQTHQLTAKNQMTDEMSESLNVQLTVWQIE